MKVPASPANKISLRNFPILLLTLSMLQKNKVNHKVRCFESKVGERISFV